VIRHPFTLDHLAAALSTRLSGATLVEVYTQEKFTIIMRFVKDNEAVTVLASVEPQYGSILIRDNSNRARKNTIDVFPTLVGQRLATVTRHPTDRIVSFWFEHAQLHVLLYGGATGNIVATSDGMVVDALRDKHTLVHKPFVVPEFTPKLGPHYEALALGDKQADTAHVASTAHTASTSHPGDSSAIIALCEASATYYVLEREGDVLFSLLPLPGWNVLDASDDIFVALQKTISLRRRSTQLTTARSATVKQLERDRSKLVKGIAGMQSDAAQTDRASLYRMYGDMLLSVPNPNIKGEKQALLADWNGIEQTIPLDDLKTYIQNADVYYTRARKSEKAAEDRKRRLPQYVERLARIEEQLSNIEHAQTPEELGSLVQTRMEKRPEQPEPQQRYRTFELDDTYTLYVGRSAANNDELTMRFAKQNDWWFHARGVSGSHAVLRGGEGAEKPPKKILEQAAAIAAYYSQARNASYVPVVYTQRKNVRKPKGANVGAVTLERETVIMVKPEAPAGAE